MPTRIALFVMLSIGLVWGQVQLQFPICTSGSPAGCSSFVQPGATYSIVLVMANGDRLLVGTQPVSSSFGTPRQAIALSAIGKVPFQNGLPPDLLPTLGGSGNDQPAAATLDPQGNIWIVGSTNSDDFNLFNPIVSEKVPYRTAGFVIELDPTGVNLLFASYLCGHQPGSPEVPDLFASYASNIEFDSTGNAYIAGTTDETDFPVTPGAFQTEGGGTDSFGETFFYSFVAKISPEDKLIYSTLLGSSPGGCTGGSSCIGRESASTVVNGLAVDATGNVTISGITNAPSFPVTAGVLQQDCDCATNVSAGFVSRLTPDASKLLWSTFVGSASFGAISYLGMAEDAEGNVDLVGDYAPYAPTSVPPLTQTGTPGLFAAQLSSDGSHLTYSTDLGQSPNAASHGIALDSTRNVYLTGTTSSTKFPGLPNVPTLGADFVLELGAMGAPQSLVWLPTGTVSGQPLFDASGNLLLVSGQVALLQFPAEFAVSAPAVVGYSNSASFAVNRGLYPGALVSLFGFQLVSAAQIAVPDASGKFPTTLAGVQVLLNSIPAPLLYAGPNQINFQVPFETGQNDLLAAVQLQVMLPSGAFTMQVPLSPSLGLFMSSGGQYAVALNQDGTANSATNPAPPGSVITLFGTGALSLSLSSRPSLADGLLASGAAPLSQETNDFQVVDTDGIEASILYAGTAPGLIDGLFQLNIQLPVGEVLTSHTLTLRSGASSPFGTIPPSNGVEIYSQ
jgi:uncharacterized protein (TIGR03437 family)